MVGSGYLTKNTTVKKMIKLSKEKENQIIKALKRGNSIHKIKKDLNTYYYTVKEVIDANLGIYKPKKASMKNNRYSFRVPAEMAFKINTSINSQKITTSKFFNNLLNDWGCGDE